MLLEWILKKMLDRKVQSEFVQIRDLFVRKTPYNAFTGTIIAVEVDEQNNTVIITSKYEFVEGSDLKNLLDFKGGRCLLICTPNFDKLFRR